MRGLAGFAAVDRQGFIAHVIGHDQNDIGRFRMGCPNGGEQENEKDTKHAVFSIVGSERKQDWLSR